MAGHRDPPQQYQFKKGQSGNPGGMQKDSIAKKVLKKYTQALIEETYNKFIKLSAKDLKTHIQLENIPIVEVIVAKALLLDSSRGTLNNTEKILDRIIGKVPQKTEKAFYSYEGIPIIPPVIKFISIESIS